MIRLFLRSVAINLVCVYVAAQILSGVIVYIGGIRTLFLAAVVIAIVNLLVKPVVNLLLLPLNLVTLGLFRWVSNLVTLFVVTKIVPDLQIHSFTYPGANLGYIIIPPIDFSAFGAFVVATLTLTLTFHFIYWLLQD